MQIALALGLGLAACGPQAPSTNGQAEQPVTAGTEGMDGEGPPDDLSMKDRAARGIAISPVPIATDGLSARQRRLVGLGSYIVNASSDCAACHTGTGFLSGGSPFFLGGADHVVWSRNLTPDAVTGMQLTFAQFKESMRTGRDFRPGESKVMVVMPWTTLRWASDLDLEAIYAYLRAIPAVSNAVPPDVKGDLPLPVSVPFPGALYTDGDVVRRLRGTHRSFDSRRGLSISPLAQPRDLRGEELEGYGVGSYIANALAHCNDCHTHPDRTPDSARVNTAAFLTGGTVFAVPPPLQPVLGEVRTMSANLKGAGHGFFSEPDDSYQRFHDIITTGTLVDETPARPLAFPMDLVAGNLGKLLEGDLRDLYAYVKDTPSTTGASDQASQGPARWCAADADCATGETCATGTSECVGGACTSDEDCGACQTCGEGACQAPAPDSACLASAQ